MDEARRRDLANTMTKASTLEDVAEAIAAFGEHTYANVYVERRDGGYRWSPAHAGGPYPLLREVARFLDLDHHALIVPFATMDGRTVVSPEGPRMSRPEAWAFIAPSADRRAVAGAVLATLAGWEPEDEHDPM